MSTQILLFMANSLLHTVILLLCPPMLVGLINRVKARAAGRTGASIWQPYWDLQRLWQKGVVYSQTTTWIFRAMPVVFVASGLCCGLLIPLHTPSAPLDFEGSILVCAALLGIGRVATVLAALDTGSSFEGMGASREISFAALAEPAFYLVMAIFCLPAHSLSFSGIFAALPWEEWGFMHPEYLVAAAALFLVMLAENSRIPVDDPNTHLELTMIHEVMILDHSGPDLAAILYGSAIKLFLFAALITHILLPVPNTVWGLPIFLLGIVLVGLCIGVVESGMGRLSLKRVPQLLVGASVLALVALGVLFFRGLA